ncbi:hypothetical protein Sulku_0320 [Sulfuricurvum kujiense DSM 16994]|uniref:Prepilin-type N-terminal cleavage/methylation domain-containing protein n=1 Tax=Sulfuricurvum kujiense (strain ATCC BAA-921 / DSM 16994 / JCM 11577 / YK-1) TaxID=709032 RepID=E4TYL0_SULKY|nr:hypothetical protein [Sulfuricurvum kujiense]ADR32987.1 hypothetical protein Sulku_0320 [Sulfuricurvum kujiense DSM 16994]
MRFGMTMIELVFAIVIIAISIVTIPSMMSVANNASKGVMIDEDVMERLGGWVLDKFQGRWDRNYLASGSAPLNISGMKDLNCSRTGGYRIGSDENTSSMKCNMAATPSVIPAVAGNNPGQADGNISRGIEQLNNGSETISITAANGTVYNVTATYSVAYVDSIVTPLTGSNTQTATWILGSSTNMNPSSPSGNTGNTISHLKRVVTRFNNPDVNITLSFFKSNKGN